MTLTRRHLLATTAGAAVAGTAIAMPAPSCDPVLALTDNYHTYCRRLRIAFNTPGMVSDVEAPAWFEKEAEFEHEIARTTATILRGVIEKTRVLTVVQESVENDDNASSADMLGWSLLRDLERLAEGGAI